MGQSGGDMGKIKTCSELTAKKLCLLPSTPNASRNFALWKRKLEIYTDTLEATDKEKFNILINRLDITPYGYVDSINDYKEAMDKLEKAYDKKINKIYAG